MGVDLLNRDSIRRNALRPTAISKNFWDILERLVKGNRSCVRISHTAQCIAPYYSLFQSVANGIFYLGQMRCAIRPYATKNIYAR